MAGRGPAPKEDRVGHVVPTRGEIQQADAPCWKGDVPPAPEGLMDASLEAWSVWFGSWWAAFWTPADLPALRQVIRLYDQVERGEFQRCAELRMMMDTYGVTPKGQQDRRWKAPVAPEVAKPGTPSGDRYKLRAV